MCRIVGLWDFRSGKNYGLDDVICKMRDSMIYGGPDDFGHFTDHSNRLSIGHRRLSILDLTTSGKQPMSFENLHIVYNGEVYNFNEIRTELESYGYTFSSQSDTEVILKSYHRWGKECVKKFRGMWAFAIYDSIEKKLILSRDRIGVKPLFWYYKDGLFMFSSEMKGFHVNPDFDKQIDYKAVSLFLQYGYITAPYSIFKYSHKLEPGTFLTITASGEITKESYWNLNDYYHDNPAHFSNKSESEIIEEAEQLLRDSFLLRMVSDVPVGVFLSGGIDSSLVTTLIQKSMTKPLKTFTIGFEQKKYNEADWAKKISCFLGTDHTEYYCNSKEAFDVIQKLPDIYDEPIGDSSAIPTYLVSKIARNDVKVSLSADGGDEQFCGYNNYYVINKLNKLLPKNPFGRTLFKSLNPDTAYKLYSFFRFVLPKWNDFHDKYKKVHALLDADSDVERYDIAKKFFQIADLSSIGLNDITDHTSNQNAYISKSLESFQGMMYLDIVTYLPDDILVKLDRATMSVALEGRDPFLDHKIVEYTSKLPLEYKYHNGTSKYLLKQILKKYIPVELYERPKKGFGAPIYEWFKNDLKPLYQEYLDPEKIKKDNIFEYKEITRIMNSYYNNEGINPHKLWFLLVFQMWKSRWL